MTDQPIDPKRIKRVHRRAIWTTRAGGFLIGAACWRVSPTLAIAVLGILLAIQGAALMFIVPEAKKAKSDPGVVLTYTFNKRDEAKP